MISMSKSDIVRYMEDYANVMYLSMHNPNVSVGKLFDSYMIDKGRVSECTIEYYDRMRRVYVWYSLFRTFSFIEDYLLNRDDFISNNDLVDLEQGAIIYTNRNGITNKRIVQLMRNAFNHNDDSDFERFKLSVNGKYCEIEFKDIRTDKEKASGGNACPFRMKFDIDYLIKVARKINREKQNVLALSFKIPEDFDILSLNLEDELDKILFVRYYFPRKMDRGVINDFHECLNVVGLDLEEIKEKSEFFHEHAKNQNHMIGEYALTKEQKEKLISIIRWYRENLVFGDETLKENSTFYMYYFLCRVIPIPLLKSEIYDKQVIVAGNYLLDTNISYHDITERARNLVNGEVPSFYDDVDIEIHNGLANRFKTEASKMRFFMDMIDGEFYSIYPIVSYVDFVITHIVTCDKIVIDGIEYDKEKIRNSFVHGRWFISSCNEIVMFDADPRNVNDYKLEFLGKINILQFMEWASSYMKVNYKGKKRVKNN